MFKLSRLAAVLISGALISLSAHAEGGKPLATVNGQAIAQSTFDAFVAEQKAQGAQETPEMKNAVKEELIRRELIMQEAKKKGLDKKTDIQAQVELAKQAILIRAYLADYMRTQKPSEERLKAEYDGLKSSMGGTEYKSRHILVESEETAKNIISRLEKGEKFGELAKQSKDPGSKDKGGELGWSAPAAYVKPFGDALTALKKGEYTKSPIKTDFGYHVIQLDDTRALTPPTFEQIKPQLIQRANQQTLEKLINDLRSKAKIN